MATFIPQVQGHLATVEAFQPDFGFIQGWLETKQGKYNEGLAQINSAYSLLKDLPLTLDENISKRDQFFANADSQIKRMASMDLSLDQNVMAAKNIFNPLATDEALLEDFGITTQAYAVMNTANRFRNSGDESTRKRYNPISSNYAALKLEEYKMSDADRRKQIAGQGIKYVDNVDVMDRATQIADALKLDITAPAGTTKDGAYDITMRNGDLILGPLSSAIKMQLSSDPLVAEYFNQQGYVAVQSELQARAKEVGYESAQAEMIQKYVDNPALMAAAEAEKAKNERALQNLQSEREQAENQIRSEGIAPGSEEHKRYLAILSGIKQLEQTNQSLENIGATLVKGSYDRRLEDAYYNAGLMSMDMQLSNAAEILSLRNAEIKHSPNVYFKMKREHEYRMDEILYKQQLKDASEKAQADAIAASDPFQLNVDASGKKMPLLGSPTDENGDPITSIESQEINLKKLKDESWEKQKAFIDALQNVDPAVKKMYEDALNGLSSNVVAKEFRYLTALEVYKTVAEQAETKGWNLINVAGAHQASVNHTALVQQQSMRFREEEASILENNLSLSGWSSTTDNALRPLLLKRDPVSGQPLIATKEQFMEAARETSWYRNELKKADAGDWIRGNFDMSFLWNWDEPLQWGTPSELQALTQKEDTEDKLEDYWDDVQSSLNQNYQAGKYTDVRAPFVASSSVSVGGAGGINVQGVVATYTSGKNIDPRSLAYTQINSAVLNGRIYEGNVYNGELSTGGNPVGSPSQEAEAAFEYLNAMLSRNIGKNNEDSPRPSVRVVPYAGEDNKYTALEYTFDEAWISKNRVTDNANTSGRPIPKSVNNTITIVVPSNQFFAPGIGNSETSVEWNRVSSSPDGRSSFTVPGVVDGEWENKDGILSFRGNWRYYDPASGRYANSPHVQSVGTPANPAGYDEYLNLRKNVWDKVQELQGINANNRYQYLQAHGVKDPNVLANE